MSWRLASPELSSFLTSCRAVCLRPTLSGFVPLIRTFQVLDLLPAPSRGLWCLLSQMVLGSLWSSVLFFVWDRVAGDVEFLASFLKSQFSTWLSTFRSTRCQRYRLRRNFQSRSFPMLPVTTDPLLLYLCISFRTSRHYASHLHLLLPVHS